MAERSERFRTIMLPHLNAAYSFAHFLARDPVAAEDIVQDAFLNALRGFDAWRGGSPKAWLLTIVRNCFLAQLPARPAPLPIEEAEIPAADAPTPEQLLIDQHEAAHLRLEIAKLPLGFREVLILRELEELSYREISTIVDIPMGTVMSRLARARHMLGTRLTAKADTDIGGHA